MPRKENKIMKLSVVIPVFNEAGTVEEILRRVRAVPLEKEIIVIDDYSTDGTVNILKNIEAINDDVKVYYHDRNRGKGAALRTGFAGVTGDAVIIQDADLEYDPQEYPNLLELILNGRADVVYGSRFLGGTHRVFFFWHYIGNKFLTLLSNMMTNLYFTDMATCYKAFRKDVLNGLPLNSDRFGFDMEFTMKIARKRCRIYEVPISYSGRTYDEGKKINWKDGIAAIYTILRYRFFD